MSGFLSRQDTVAAAEPQSLTGVQFPRLVQPIINFSQTGDAEAAERRLLNSDDMFDEFPNRLREDRQQLTGSRHHVPAFFFTAVIGRRGLGMIGQKREILFQGITWMTHFFSPR
ncbi:MAG TPA: hypothetical protein PK878_10065 [bacterium]|nr:hypothetical protein [bacterium]